MIQDVVVDEAVRLTEGLHGRPVVGGVHPIRVKFSSMRYYNFSSASLYLIGTLQKIKCQRKIDL